ncbi:iron-containing alcohol dehydrogenase family protein [Natronomonas sp.]|uniref:iron-containing alcohol dehydrogenase family protein n=1 Tax=Natronomonas sp. TaxID=2184060 RepID=UPI00262149B7|nr:iron-containing alcohol dehydrogenase family protein [Natronomonas sp.]
MDTTGGYRFAYDPPAIRHGVGCVDNLGGELGALGLGRALVVCGRTVGSRSEVIGPVREGLGDRFVGVFDRTTPKKRLDTAIACAERARELEADVLVGLGGASSIDVARVASAVAASERSPAALGEQLASTATIAVPDGTVPVAAVPTTLAGGSLSMLAGVTADPDSGLVDSPVGGGVGDPRLMPDSVVYDPELVATTPRDVLAGSAMNGFNKGLETLYSSARTPITDATATQGLETLSTALRSLGSDPTVETLDAALRGVTLAQYGVSRGSGTTFSLLHALGHALRIHTDVQLGIAHGVVAPAALEWLFGAVDGRRALLASALGVGQAADPADAVVGAVRDLRDALGLPTRLGEIDGIDRSMIEGIAAMTADSFLLANDAPNAAPSSADPLDSAVGWSGSPHAPPEFHISAEDVGGILETAW